MIDKKTFLDQPFNNKEGSYDKIQKIKNVRGENYATGFLLDYHYFKNYYEITIILHILEGEKNIFDIHSQS